MSILTSNTLTFGKQDKMGGEQVGCCGTGITNGKLAVIFQSRVVILNPSCLLSKFCTAGEASYRELEQWGIIYTEVGFFLPKNKVYLHEKLSLLHKTHQTHKPRLIAHIIIQTISLSNDENWIYSRDCLNCFLEGRRKVVLQMVLMIPQTLENWLQLPIGV